jgi:peptide subunit release factor 1 (eRF1)
MLDDPALGLEGFLREVAAGRHGRRERQEILDFLQGVERDILGSIQTRAAAGGQRAEEAERLSEECRERMAALAAKYARQP